MKNIFYSLFSSLFIFTAPTHAQTFSFQLKNDSIGYGQPAGNDIVVEGDLVNTATVAIEIDIIRKENNLPQNWNSYLCADVCLAPNQDSMRLYLPAGATQSFKLSFITSNVLDTANSLIHFKNISNSSNTIKARLYGITDPNVGLSENSAAMRVVQLSPNPAHDQLCVSANAPLLFSCFDLLGREHELSVSQQTPGYVIAVHTLPAGAYYLRVFSADGSCVIKKFIRQ